MISECRLSVLRVVIRSEIAQSRIVDCGSGYFSPVKGVPRAMKLRIGKWSGSFSISRFYSRILSSMTLEIVVINWINEAQSSLLNDINRSFVFDLRVFFFFFLLSFVAVVFPPPMTSWILPSISTLWSFHASTSFPCDRALFFSFFAPLLWNETPKLGEKEGIRPSEAAEYKIDTLSNSCATYSLSFDLLFCPRVFPFSSTQRRFQSRSTS